jgi:type I restriction enzyme S subunit
MVPKDYATYQLFRKHDLVFKLIDLENICTSRVGLVHEDGIMSSAYVRLAPSKSANIRFFYFQFFDLYTRAVFNALGAGVRSTLGAADLGELRIAIPPPDEQAAIVRFLDHANRKIDGFIRAKRKLIGLLNEQKQAIIHRAVTRGLHPDVPLKPSGIPWLGDIPQHWEVKKLRFLFRYSKGSRAAELTNEYIGHNAGAFPVFSGQTEHGGLMGRINWHEFDFAAPVVFVSTVGARAMTTRILTGKFSLSQNCALIIPRTKLANPIYFENVFQRLFSFERYSISQIMQPSLRFADLNRFYVPHPPIEEQIEIAASIELESEKLTTAIARTEREIALMQEYRTRLTADLVTGKLDVREAAAHLPAPPADPAAEEDLGEILEEPEGEKEE